MRQNGPGGEPTGQALSPMDARSRRAAPESRKGIQAVHAGANSDSEMYRLPVFGYTGSGDTNMNHTRTITILVILVVLLAAVASGTGILSREGPGPSTYMSIRGETVELYVRGLYAHMSSAVAIQGIAQDYITLCVALPLLIIALLLFRKGSLRATIVLADLLLYMLLTYLFYTARPLAPLPKRRA